MILESLEKLKEELKEMDIEISALMKKKSIMADKKREIERRIKDMMKLREESNKKLGGFSYENIFEKTTKIIDMLCDNQIETKDNEKFNVATGFSYSRLMFGDILDFNKMKENNPDRPLINSIIECAGGNNIDFFYRVKLSKNDIRSKSKDENIMKRFLEKLLHPKVRKETIRYKI
jgi:hypothetical protein